MAIYVSCSWLWCPIPTSVHGNPTPYRSHRIARRGESPVLFRMPPIRCAERAIVKLSYVHRIWLVEPKVWKVRNTYSNEKCVNSVSDWSDPKDYGESERLHFATGNYIDMVWYSRLVWHWNKAWNTSIWSSLSPVILCIRPIRYRVNTFLVGIRIPTDSEY